MPSSTPPSVQPTPSLQPIPSPAVGQSTRIDVREIKSKIFKRIGPERAKKYFQHLEMFLSSRLSKNEFEKRCLVALGRENLPLHNHLIRSILHNASRACVPPVINDPKLVRGATTSGHAIVAVWDNGGELNLNVKENKPLSRRENVRTQKSSLNHCETIMLENGVHHLSDLKRCTQFQKSDYIEPLIKRPRVEKEPLSLHNFMHSNGYVKALRENLGQEIIHQSQGPVQAPLGIQLRPGSFGLTQMPLPLASMSSKDTSDTCIEVGELCDTPSVKKRMDKMAGASGLEGVSIECANLLNNGIDVFIKQLIGSCVELVRARSRHGKLRHEALKQQMCRKLINGVSVHAHVPGQSSIIPPETNSVSMQDLKALIGLNPCLLGINSSLLLDKINSYD